MSDVSNRKEPVSPAATAIATAHSFLFVPASRPERIVKALISAADVVIVDLEDAVSPDQKDSARASLLAALPDLDHTQLARTLVRINAVDTPWFDDDIAALTPWVADGLAGVMIPKSEAGGPLVRIAQTLGPTAVLVPLIESLAGLDAVNEIARSPQVARLAFGHLDFQVDLGMQCGVEETELTAVRFALVAASRRHQLAAPVDGVTVNTSDVDQLTRDVARARALGFGAKLCIHPGQVVAVAAAFAPSDDDVTWATRVLEAVSLNGGDAFALDGKMVDRPVILRAQEIMNRT